MTASNSMPNNGYSIKDLASLLAANALGVVRYLFPRGRLAGHEYLIGNIDGAPGESLSINVGGGSKAGVWKDFGKTSLTKGGDLVDLWALARCGGNKGKAIPEIKKYLSLEESPSRRPATVTPIWRASLAAAATDVERRQEESPLNPRNHQRLQSALMNCGLALAYLHGRGIEDATIAYFGLCLADDYTDTDGVRHSKALLAPMRSATTGTFLKKFHSTNVPGLTENPKGEKGWMPGAPRTYWADAKRGQSILFVCEGEKDLWMHWQELQKHGLTDRIMLITSTHGVGIPDEWKTEDFWKPWSAVYLGQDNDEAGRQLADTVRGLMGTKDAYRAEVPPGLGKDWNDYWLNGGTIEDFTRMLDRAVVVSPRPTVTGEPNLPQVGVTYQKPRIGNFTLAQVDINNGYVNGFLYYPTVRLVVEPDPEKPDGIVCGSEQLVVRSDRTLHYCYTPKARAGLAPELFLSDGTLLLKKPVASQKHSWQYSAIDAYLSGKTQPRPLVEIVRDVRDVLKTTVWLPYEEDYVALAMTVPATYVQAVFEAVPLLALVGPPASGKTETGNVMADLCCNGDVIGQVSAAAAAREIDMTAGFVVFDDLEAIAGNTKKGEMSFSDLLQMLKVSNKKKSAVKLWHNIKTGKQERLNLFGIKLFNNTQGIDSILNTRVICIPTRPVPEYLKEDYRDNSIDPDRLTSLRSELHAWAFDHVREVDSMYSAKHANRQDEIFEPLRVMAKMAGDPALTGMLEACAGRQQRDQVSNSIDDPNALLREAAENLIRRGFQKFTVAHVQLEMRTLVDANWGKRNTTEIPEWDDSRWLGKVLHTLDLIEPESNPPERQVIFGNNLRIKQFKNWFLEEVRKSAESQGIKIVAGKRPQDFCPGCHNCQYRNAGCSVMAGRREFEEKKRMPALVQ